MDVYNSRAEQRLSNTERTRQEEDDHHRVDDGEPVNLDIAHGQVGVPSRRPLDLALLHTEDKRLSRLSSAFISSDLTLHHRADLI